MKLSKKQIKIALRRARCIIYNTQSCTACHMPRLFHVKGKCLFESTYFKPTSRRPRFVGFPHSRRRDVPAFVKDLVRI